MMYLALIALATLIANGGRQLRFIAIAFAGVSVIADAIASGVSPASQLAVTAAAGFVAAGILFVAARDNAFGEDPGWRLWLGTFTAAIATPIAYASFRTVAGEPAALPLLEDGSGVIVEVAGIWLLSSGVAILLTARSAVRTALAGLVMITGVQLLARLLPGSHLTSSLVLAWLEVVVALGGAFLIVNERAVLES